MAMFTGGACLLIALSASLFSAQVAQRQGAEQVQAELNSLARNLVDRLDFRMFERFREIRNIAELQPLKSIWEGPPETVRAVMEQLQSTLPEYAWIGFAVPDGTVRAATKGLLEGASVASRPWFSEGLKAPTVQDVHDAKLLAQKLGERNSSEPFRFVDVAVPVRDANGSVLGVLGAHMSWTWATEVRRLVLANLDPRQGTDVWILDESGNALLGPAFGSAPFPSATIADIRRSKHGEFVDGSETPTLTSAVVTKGHQNYPGLGWIVVARRPVDLAFAPAQRLALGIIIVGLALAALVSGVAAALAMQMTKPLHRLAESVDLIGRDDTVTMVGRGHGSSDVVRLSSSVRSLLRRIGTAETEEEAAKREVRTLADRMEEKTRRFGEDLNALQTLADRDPLTGLLNRRAFQVFAKDAMSFFHRYKRPIAILVIDIDFFKRVNDTIGHSAGDEVICAVGRAVDSAVRGTDKVARFGGEEFVVLLRETDQLGASLFAERLRRSIADAVIQIPRHSSVQVTVSIGLALAVEQDRDISDVVERADRGLYRAKSAGRNCVMIGESEFETKQAA